MNFSDSDRADWPGIVEALATGYAAATGKPIRRDGDKLRIGSRGSLAVFTDTGRWHDFETGSGGGALDWMIAVEGAADNADASRMLRDRGLLEDERARKAHKSGDNPPSAAKRNDSGLYGNPKPPPASESGPNPADARLSDERRKRDQAGRIWRAGSVLEVDAEIPGAAYLRERFRVSGEAGDANGFLRPDWRGALPDSIRWLSLADWPNGCPRPPREAAGCLLFLWINAAGAFRGVSAMAIAGDGTRIEWGGKARMIGARSGLLHILRRRNRDQGGRWHIAEGELSALALTVWPNPAQVSLADGIAACGSAGRLSEAAGLLPDPVTIWAENDRAGFDAAEAARLTGAAIVYCSTWSNVPGADPLDAVIALNRVGLEQE